MLFEKKQGNGNALRRVFMEINAGIFAVVDADLTYFEKDCKNYMCAGNKYVEGMYLKNN